MTGPEILTAVLGGLGVFILGGLYEAVRLLRRGQRRDRDVELAVLGEPARQGVDEVPSMRKQFADVAKTMAKVTQKLDEISERPAMNGGFSRLTATVDRLEDNLREASVDRASLARSAAAGLEAAREAARKADLAAQRADAADRRAQEVADLARQNHAELTSRLNDNDEIGRTMLTSLAEEHHIDLRGLAGGELHGSVHMTLSPPEEPDDA
jgi:chromosome segregation ATPase